MRPAAEVPVSGHVPVWGDRCTCGASKAPAPDGQGTICNLTDCQLPWAVAYRAGLRPSLWERITGWILLLIGRRP
jgi:hypothetical protein